MTSATAFPTLADFFRDSVGDVDGVIAAATRAADDSTRSFPANDLTIDPPLTQRIGCRLSTSKRSGPPALPTSTVAKPARKKRPMVAMSTPVSTPPSAPRIFFKASAKNTVGPLAAVGIRMDSQWNVPEPELGLVFNPAMEMLGFTIGNDMSSRDIEGANPLYLPQAKVYTASCAVGPGILLAPSDDWLVTTIRLSISRAGSEIFSGAISTDQIKRSIPELADYLGRSNSYPGGVILLTGAGIVPPADFTLRPADLVTIMIDGIGTLQNHVIKV